MNLSRYGFKRFHNSLLCPQSYFINIRVRILLLKLVFLIFHWKQNFPKIRDRLLELDIHKYLKHNMFKYKPNLSHRKPVLPYGLLIYIMLLPSTQYSRQEYWESCFLSSFATSVNRTILHPITRVKNLGVFPFFLHTGHQYALSTWPPKHIQSKSRKLLLSIFTATILGKLPSFCMDYCNILLVCLLTSAHHFNYSLFSIHQNDVFKLGNQFTLDSLTATL